MPKRAVEHASKNNGFNVVILDTAGRLHVDESMMDELVAASGKQSNVYQTILVVDAMTGQDAVNVAGTFNDKVGIDGVILTQAGRRYPRRRGPFHPLRHRKADPHTSVWEKSSLTWSSFIRTVWPPESLGMGDIQSLDREGGGPGRRGAGQRSLSQKLRKAEFDYNDFLTQMQQIRKDGRYGKYPFHDARCGEPA